jgi:thymidylate kinase
VRGALFVSFDGPKATGKTTVLEAVAAALRQHGRYRVVSLCEKELDPFRSETLGLIKALTARPSRDLESLVCERLAAGRSWITQNIVREQTPGSVVLIDRWYPSDAAFRRTIPFADILGMNLDRQVQIPDLHVAVVTAPDISWARAQARPRGLSSVVINSKEDHVNCTEAFDLAVARQNWFSCRNEGSIAQATLQITTRIYRSAR